MGTALNVFAALSVSYLDRIAARDMTRASIVLSKVSEVWPEFRESFAAELGVSPAQLPAAIPPIWDGPTREIVRISLPAGSETVRAMVTSIGGTTAVSALGDKARTYLEYIPTSNPARTFAARVAQTDVAALATTLNALVSAIVASSAVAASIPAPSASRLDPRDARAFVVLNPQDALRQALLAAGAGAAGGAGAMTGGAGAGALASEPTVLPTMTIRASRSWLGIPLWGWAVGGVAVIAGLGVGIYAYRRSQAS